MLDEYLKNVGVLGAAGKMGSGISLLLLQELAKLEIEKTGAIGEGSFRLQLVDSSREGLNSLKHYLRKNITKFAESSITMLRNHVTHHMSLVSNEEIINYFVTGALDIVHYSTHIEEPPHLLFEAIVENVEIKCDILKKINHRADQDIFFFSNTSSIPIHVLNSKAELDNNIIGFHFYNPPAIQKLVELIVPVNTNYELKNMASQLITRLNKIAVHSNDVAGFIGNGFFIREILYACEMVRDLSHTFTTTEAVFIVNKVTQDFLVRPMGIFQLIDYVGLDVIRRICDIMSTYLVGELFEDALLDLAFAKGLFGGVFPQGGQKDGFFQYEGQNFIGIFSFEQNTYVPINEEWNKAVGPLPEGHVGWKQMQRTFTHSKLKQYFENLNHFNSLGSELAQGFLNKSKEIARLLVDQKVAASLSDVDVVLKQGFYHLYGPNTDWINVEVGPRS